MCTVSIAPGPDGFRLVCNRDERRLRPSAAPPALHHMAATTAMFPIDPQGGGTWIGVNDAGLAAALLNRSETPRAFRAAAPVRSRGLIIPPLLDCLDILKALAVVDALDPAAFAPCRLLLVQDGLLALAANEPYRWTTTVARLTGPALFTSSSLGDALVQGPRRALFDRMMRTGNRPAAQDRFHRHQWRSSPATSVLMERPDAATVSRTHLLVGPPAIVMRYEPLAGADRRVSTLRLELSAREQAA